MNANMTSIEMQLKSASTQMAVMQGLQGATSVM